MRVAIISDVHGNLEALKATLSDIQKRHVDQIICLGDTIAKGVHAEDCVRLIRENCAVVLRGNCDRHFSANYDSLEAFSEIEQERIRWNQSRLSKESREYLYGLPFCHEFYMSGSLIRLFHATPAADYVAVIAEDSIQTKYEMFLPTPQTISQSIADVVIYGHIHHPYMDRLYNKTIICAGSVGNSFDVIRNPDKDSNALETTKSNYLIIEGEYGSKSYGAEISFQFVRVSYDIQKELMDEAFNLEFERDNYRFELMEGKYRNMTKINDNFRRLGVDVDKI